VTLYAETSAVLAWLFGEPEGKKARERIDAATRVVTSVLTTLEAERAVSRAESAALVTAADAQKLRGLLARAVRQWSLLEMGAAVRRRASQAFPVEPVRTLDAIHLASALEFLTLYPDLEMLSFDGRITGNLEPLGLTSSA
jgi:uncharacterized protein with PIN domain